MLLKNYPKKYLKDIKGSMITNQNFSVNVLDVLTREEFKLKYPTYDSKVDYDHYIMIESNRVGIPNFAILEYHWTLEIKIEGLEI